MRRPLSLSLRLTLLFGIAAAIIFPVFGWVINSSMENHFETGDVDELNVIASAIEEGLSSVQSADDFTSLERRFEDILLSHHRASLYVLDRDKQPIYSSPEPALDTIAHIVNGDPDVNAVHQWSDPQHSYRILIQRIGKDKITTNPRYTIAIAIQIDYHLQYLERFRQTLWFVIAGSIAIMTLMGWLAVHQGHAPLRDIVARVRRISASELNTRLPPESMPGELTDLAVSFNEMLQRVDKAFHRLSDYNADIAHELRTPITNLMTQTQVALSRTRTLDEYREILYSNMEEYERMAQIVGDMLFLAQTASNQEKRNHIDLDLAMEVQSLFDYYEGWVEENSVTLVVEGTATVPGNRLMLQRALGNLLSNAIRHTEPGETVRVEIGTSNDGNVSIVVENPGAGIPPEHIPRLFDRFYRIDPSRPRDGSGAGLGLAIVKSIVEAHGGTIDVVSTAGRTRFQILLPSTPATQLQE